MDRNISRKIASIVGPVLIVLSVSELINLNIWADTRADLVYLNGLLLFTAGFSIVRFHNLWSFDWRVLVTLVGWLLVFGGVYRLFFPTAPQMDESVATYALISVNLLIGVILTAASFRR